MAKQTKTTKSAPVAPVAPVAPRIARPGIATIVAAGADAAVLRLASVPKHVAGGNSGSEQALVALRAAMGDKGTCTVAEYKAARATKGMPAHVGGYLPAWVERGNVVVETAEVGAATSPKGRKGKSPKGK